MSDSSFPCPPPSTRPITAISDECEQMSSWEMYLPVRFPTTDVLKQKVLPPSQSLPTVSFLLEGLVPDPGSTSPRVHSTRLGKSRDPVEPWQKPPQVQGRAIDVSLTHRRFCDSFLSLPCWVRRGN